MGRRIRWLGLVLVLCFALVILQLVNVQFRQAPALDSAAANPRNAATSYDNDRGLILAASGTVLAKSVKVANPSTSPHEYYRTYPTGTLFSGIVGYSSLYRGTAGVEYEYNKELVPHHQTATSLSQLLSPPAPTTDDVTLTVQPALQEVAKQALAAVPDANKDGAVVALAPKTGAVLAMYSSPSFDPNTLSNPDLSTEEAASKADFTTKDAEGFLPGLPIATWYPFLPGSTFKVVTSSAAYNLQPSLSGFTFPATGCTVPGAIPTTTNTICNDADTPVDASTCGGTMVQMLPESCDPGYATLGLKLGPTTLSKQAELFGYNTVPPIDLTTVSTSRFPAPKDLAAGADPGPPGLAYAAFGQGTVSTTALQNAMVAEGIADTGVVMTPHVMAEIHNSQGGVVESYQPTVYETATTPTAAKAVNHLMQLVVTTPRGTAHGDGFPSQDDVAVKTGTAQIGTATKKTDDWMIGFAPASDPTVAVAVVVPYQPTDTTGAGIAGPIFKAVVEAALAEEAAAATSTTSTTTTTTTPKTAHRAGTTTTAPVPSATTPPTTVTTAPAAPTTTAAVPPTTTTAVPPTATTTTTTKPAVTGVTGVTGT